MKFKLNRFAFFRASEHIPEIGSKIENDGNLNKVCENFHIVCFRLKANPQEYFSNFKSSRQINCDYMLMKIDFPFFSVLGIFRPSSEIIPEKNTSWNLLPH